MNRRNSPPVENPGRSPALPRAETQGISQRSAQRDRLFLAIVVLLFLVGALSSLYTLAAQDVRQHTATLPGWVPFTEPRFGRVRPSLHHGLWFEFQMTNRFGQSCVAYWRLWPWRGTEIYANGPCEGPCL